MDYHNSNSKISYNWFALLTLGICSILLLIRSFYSFNWSDESFYLTVVHRFWLGERIIADEWYTTQLSTPLLLPFYALYQWMTGGNEGVYLYFRLLYWGISAFTAFFTYYSLKKKNSYAASLISALLYFLYSRANIGGMSYYNVTLTCVLLAGLLLYDQICDKKGNKKKLYLAGILLAFAVVNTPFLAFPYIVIGAYFLIRRKHCPLYREVLMVIAGTATIAAVYIAYVLCKVSINELLLNIPYILNEPELQSTNPALVIPIILARIVWRFKWTFWITVLLTIYIWYRKKKVNSFSMKEINWLLGINLAVFIINSFLSKNLLGCINIAGALFAVPTIYIFNEWKQIDKNILGVFGTAGISLILGFSFSSDTGLDAMTIGFLLIGIGAVLLVFKLDDLKKKQVMLGAAVLVFSVMIFQTAILRFFSVYRDAPVNQLNTQITSGPAKYLYTTQEHVRQYDELKAAIEQYVREDDVVFYSKWCFWSYLCTENEYGVPSSWRMPFDSPRLQEYYELKPEKIPTCIFVLNPAYGDFESSLIQNNEKVEFPNENNLDGYLYDYIQEHDYEVIELECATIYRSR